MLVSLLHILQLIALCLVVLILAAVLIVGIVALIVFLVKMRKRSKATSDTAGAATAAPAELTPSELTQQLNALKNRIDSENKSFISRVKNLGIVLTFLVTLLVAPKTFVEVRNALFSKPDTHITQESDLSITLERKSIKFGFAFTIVNNNSKHIDTIKSLAARLVRIDQHASKPLLSTGEANFEFTEEKAQIQKHLAVTATPRAIDSYVEFFLSDEDRRNLLIPQSRWQLIAELTGDDQQSHNVKYCFDISQDDVDALFSSQESQSVTIRNAFCDE